MQEVNRDEIKKTLIRIVSSVLDISEQQITEEKELNSDLRIDSLALYEIVVDVEDTYSIRVSNDEADDLLTVGDAIDFVVEKIRHS